MNCSLESSASDTVYAIPLRAGIIWESEMPYQFYPNKSEINDYEDDMRLIEGILNALLFCIPFWIVLLIIVVKFI